MTLQKLLLKFSILAFTIIIFKTGTYAQAQVNTSQENKSAVYYQEFNNNAVTGLRLHAPQADVREKVNNEHISKPAIGTGARKCTQKNTSNPFAISRENFNKLPADRQLFLLENSLIYTIVD